jgi:hypothetical protein
MASYAKSRQARAAAKIRQIDNERSTNNLSL